MTISPEHREKLAPLLPEDTDPDAYGILSAPEGVAFPWKNRAGEGAYQLMPDNPRADSQTGRRVKYEFPAGAPAVVHQMRDDDPAGPVLIVEGTKQRYWADRYAPAYCAVYAVAGCWMWKDDLTFTEGREVFILMDGDWQTNRDVFDAVKALREQLELSGAVSAKIVRIPAGRNGNDGLDDILAALPQDKRASSLARWIDKATEKMGRGPARKAGNPYFTPQGGLLAQSASRAVLASQPAALAKGSMVALYRDGVYRLDRGKEPLYAACQTLLGEDYRPNWRATVEESLIGILAKNGTRIPERSDKPYLNCSNGMLDLETGELHPHDPSYLSAQQIPVPWDPDAACPSYEAWLGRVCPDQWRDLEESVSTMLDPSRTPHKAVFLFGPSRSGKSTFLRLMMSVAGAENTSGVDLHQLSDNKFAAANIYQRMLNSSADLDSAHVENLSLFKRMTGEDPILADRKYGDQFSYTNTALFAFAANTLPTVSESSRAYVERIKPFRFPHSFAGQENQAVEDAIHAELPGILVRWAAAWRRYHDRGGYLPTDAGVLKDFETRSDRVAMWLSQRCDIHPDAAGTLVGPDQGTPKKALYALFKAWCTEEGGAGAMRFGAFLERLGNAPGVGEVRLRYANKNIGLNITAHDRGETDFTDPSGANRAEPIPPGVGGVGSVEKIHSLHAIGYEEKMIIKDIERHGGNEFFSHSTHSPYTRQVVAEPAPRVTMPFSLAAAPAGVAWENPATVATARGRDLDQDGDLDGQQSTRVPRRMGDRTGLLEAQQQAVLVGPEAHAEGREEGSGVHPGVRRNPFEPAPGGKLEVPPVRVPGNGVGRSVHLGAEQHPGPLGPGAVNPFTLPFTLARQTPSAVPTVPAALPFTLAGS